MGFATAIKTCFRKYFDFRGRASRPEYWFFVLFIVLMFMVGILLGLVLTSSLSPSNQLGIAAGIWLGLTFFGSLIPLWAAAVRRLHDSDRSGWWLLLSFIPTVNIIFLVFLCLDGTPGDNRFGPVPPGS